MISKFLNKRLWRAGVLFWLFCPSVLSAHEQNPPSNFLKTAAAVNVKAPDFVLVNQDNQRFESSRLRGKVIVLNFIFTTCTDVCPIFTANLAALQRKLNDRHGTDLFFVSITNINLVIFQGSYPSGRAPVGWEYLLFRRVRRSDAFSASPVRTSLTSRAPGGTTGRRAVRPIPVLSY